MHKLTTRKGLKEMQIRREIWLKLCGHPRSSPEKNSFPKIRMQNKKQLQEFGDLLLELQCAKNDGRIKGLQILEEPAYLGETYRRQAPC